MQLINSLSACLAATCLFAAGAMAHPQDIVEGPAKQPLRSEKFGTCVQTKWTADSDVCAPAQPPKHVEVVVPAPAPAPQPVMKLAREDLTIYFSFNKSELTTDDKRKLDQIAQAVNNSSKVNKVNIVGYTDKIGSNSYNDKLSVKRANAAKAYVDAKMRIPAGVVGLRGLGEKNPVTQGCEKLKKNRKKEIACLARDRRVEIEFEFQQ